MLTKFLTLPLLLCLLVAWSSAHSANASGHLYSDQSRAFELNTINLRDNKWQEGNAFELSGYWNFSWQNLVSSNQERNLVEWTQMHVPGSWDQRYFKGPDDVPPLPPKGYGSYYIRVLVPHHLPEVYLYLPDMASAYEIWSNGNKLGGNGRVGDSKETEQPDYLPKVYALKPDNGIVDIFIQTSNYHYQWGGLWYPPKITDESGLFQIRERPLIDAMIVATVLVSSSIFCFLLFWSRPQEKKILYFALFCLSMGIRRLCIDERVLYLTDTLSWQTLQAIENITMYLLLPFFLSYIRHVFPKTMPARLPFFGWFASIPFCIAVLTMEVETYSSFNLPFQLLIAVFLPVIMLGWVKALVSGHPGAKIFGVSLCVFLLATINDILNYNYVIETTNLIHVGALAFVLFQLASLIQRYLNNFKEIETLSLSLREQNKELMQLDQFKDEFLASTSHELRTPLHGIAGLAKTLKQESKELSDGDKNKVTLIESTAKRLGNLVDDILDVSSMKHGKLKIHITPTQLEPFIENTIHSLSPLIKDKKLTLDYQIDKDANHVLADEQRLQQILFNVLGNAIKFTPEGSIHIEAQKRAEMVIVRVSDTGIGIPEDKLSSIQKPFETFSKRPNQIRGSGLGLPITKMLVDLHEGQLTIRSKEGAGTTVEFSLRTAESAQSGETSHQTLSTDTLHSLPPSISPEDIPVNSKINPLTQGAEIFYADDEEVNRELVLSQVAKAGFKVSLFSDAQTLIDALEKTTPDLVLLDWMMPGKSGLQACKEIRAIHDHHELPIVMLTAKQQIPDIVQALNAGANDYLTKPYHEQELLARINSQVSSRKLVQASLENERLRQDIKAKEAESKNLCGALNASSERILLLNEELDIVFANSASIEFFDLEEKSLFSSPIADHINEDSLTSLLSFLNSEEQQGQLSLTIEHIGETLAASLEKSLNDKEAYLTLIIRQSDERQSESTQQLLSNLTKELAENRHRMNEIETALLQLNDEDHIEEDQENHEDEPKELVVKTLRSALTAWERSTHRSKIDLAEESRCWRVYIDGTTAKTRTLDKYLSVKTLPAKPRWRAVIKTANYVLDHCELNDHDQEELRALTAKLNSAYS